MPDRTPDDVRRRAWTWLRHRARTELALHGLGLGRMTIEPALIEAVEKIANSEQCPDPSVVLAAAKSILDANICARRAMRPDNPALTSTAVH
jgi:hypothetical protein